MVSVKLNSFVRLVSTLCLGDINNLVSDSLDGRQEGENVESHWNAMINEMTPGISPHPPGCK